MDFLPISKQFFPAKDMLNQIKISVQPNNFFETFNNNFEIDIESQKSKFLLLNSGIKVCFDFGYFCLITPFRFVPKNGEEYYSINTNKLQQVLCAIRWFLFAAKRLSSIKESWGSSSKIVIMYYLYILNLGLWASCHFSILYSLLYKRDSVVSLMNLLISYPNKYFHSETISNSKRLVKVKLQHIITYLYNYFIGEEFS
jgi:hypothetical protein